MHCCSLPHVQVVGVYWNYVSGKGLVPYSPSVCTLKLAIIELQLLFLIQNLLFVDPTPKTINFHSNKNENL
jgi:hypothetical protein